ncbi:MAG: hypothetical protein HUK21_03105 [Fibrobacteraceae bacterium]|nr:hypothetical protein [Fibrobacteraceae bacterium]
MNETTLNKLKNKALGCASKVLVRVDLATEEAKLKSSYQSLGEKLHQAIGEDLISTIKDDPYVVELLGSIEESKRKIQELKDRNNKEDNA